MNCIDALADKVEAHVGYSRGRERKALFRAGTRIDSPLSRQHAESISSYHTRRRRWISRVMAIHTKTRVSDNALADYLHACAGLTKDEQTMIINFVGKRLDIDIS